MTIIERGKGLLTQQAAAQSGVCGLFTPIASLASEHELTLAESLKSFDEVSITAAELAQERGLHVLAERLQPKILHPIETSVLVDLQSQLRSLMQQRIGQFARDTTFHYPQLSVLQELEHPKLWTPITGMQGVSISPQVLRVGGTKMAD